MEVNSLSSFFAPGLWVKILALVAIGFYTIFTFVVFTQVRVMGEILHLPHVQPVLKSISIINIVLAVSLFLLAIVIL